MLVLVLLLVLRRGMLLLMLVSCLFGFGLLSLSCVRGLLGGRREGGSDGRSGARGTIVLLLLLLPVLRLLFVLVLMQLLFTACIAGRLQKFVAAELCCTRGHYWRAAARIRLLLRCLS